MAPTPRSEPNELQNLHTNSAAGISRNKKYVLWNMVSAPFWRFGHKQAPNCIFFHCACAKRPYFYFRSKIRRRHRVTRPRFPITCRNFGDAAINVGQIAYFSLRMCETAIYLLPVENLTLPSCSSTPISNNSREFWRYVNI